MSYLYVYKYISINGYCYRKGQIRHFTRSRTDSQSRSRAMFYSKLNYVFKKMYVLYIFLWIVTNYYLQYYLPHLYEYNRHTSILENKLEVSIIYRTFC